MTEIAARDGASTHDQHEANQMAAVPNYEIKVRDSNGNVASAYAKHAGKVEQLRQIFINQQKLGNMPAGVIVSIEMTANPKIPTAMVEATVKNEKGVVSKKSVPVASIIGVGNKPQ